MATRAKRVGEERLIKKYPNRRLYDTQTSTYVTLADIKGLVMANEVFKVIDAKSDEDLTRNILLQIILEEEAGGAPVFSSQMLSQIIRFYGNSMQGLMGNYLEKTMQSFVDIHNINFLKCKIDTNRTIAAYRNFGFYLVHKRVFTSMLGPDHI
jgi:polyhydroxyalkanoate synthesis repressor PhaR